MKNLITAIEVIKTTPVNDNFPVAHINKVLHLTEQHEFLSWLGLDFYNLLKDDLADHSGASLHISGNTYSNGDKVLFEDYVYTSTANNNTDAPINSSNWVLADKFGTSEYNTLWDGYLKMYLSLLILKAANPFATFQIDSGGTSESYSEQGERKSASKGIFALTQDNLQTLIGKAHTALKNYLDKAVLDNDKKGFYEELGFLKEHKPKAYPKNRARRRILYPK